MASLLTSIGPQVALFSPNTTVYMARCIRPDHRDSRPSMLISEDHVYCFGCGSFWWPDQFLRELDGRELDLHATPRRRAKQNRYIPLAMVQTYNKWLNTHYARRLEWLYARGLRLETINLNLLGYDGSAFVIPVMDGTDVLALRFRKDPIWDDSSLDENPESKYWGLPGRNEVTLYKPRIPESTAILSDALHLCEGELDALRLVQEGIPAWSLTNGCRSFRPEHTVAFENRVVKIVYDQDSAGRQAAHRIARYLHARVVTWPEVLGKDVTEYLQRWSLASFIKHL